MAQIPYSGFVVGRFRGSARTLLPLGFTGWVLLAPASALPGLSEGFQE